ncbi:MAG: ATPase domain-containing protein, partial [Treponemataceae bacterium]
MAKKKTGASIFKCSNCSYIQPRWLGRCPECGEWNTFEECIEEISTLNTANVGVQSNTRSKPCLLANVNPLEGKRLLTGISELDRVLGGGAMMKSAILIGGEPGIGKSTLLLQTASSVAKNAPVLYVSGEESSSQIRNRADRLCISFENIHVLSTTRFDDIEEALRDLKPTFVVIDSIQTVYSAHAGNIPGSINQLKLCGQELITWVKEHEAVLFFTAHITKDGNIAGPKALEHMVDTVISFERSSDEIRFLRSQKNRFGSVDELGIFAMEEKGLIPVDDPSSLFITRRAGNL